MNHGLVSIIITVFNEEKFVSQTIESYLCQSHGNIEIIIVNDGSTDSTRELLEQYRQVYRNIKVIDFEKNSGKVAAQNAAFEQASGEYIAISGGDDYGCFSRIKSQVAHLKENDLDFVYSNLYLVDEQNRCLLNKPVFYTRKPPEVTLRRVLQGKGVPGGTILFTRELAEKIYPLPSSLAYEDLWFSFIACVHGRIGYIDEPLGFYRQHGQNSYGIYRKQSYRQFREKYLRIQERLVAYLEEMRKYLSELDSWDSTLERDYLLAQDILNLKLNRHFIRQIQLWIHFAWRQRQSFSFSYFNYLFFDVAIFYLWLSFLMGKR